MSGSTWFPKKVPEKVWEASVQSRVRFNKICGHLTHGTLAEVCPALGLADALERFVKIKRCGCWGYRRSLFTSTAALMSCTLENLRIQGACVRSWPPDVSSHAASEPAVEEKYDGYRRSIELIMIRIHVDIYSYTYIIYTFIIIIDNIYIYILIGSISKMMRICLMRSENQPDQPLEFDESSPRSSGKIHILCMSMVHGWIVCIIIPTKLGSI